MTDDDRREQLERALAERHHDAVEACGVGSHHARACASDFSHVPARQAIEHAVAGGGLVVTGPVGCGKTRLAAAVVAELLRGRTEAVWEFERGPRVVPRRDVVFRSVPDLLGELRAVMHDPEGRGMEGLLRMWVRVETLVLDDLGAEKGTDWANETLFRLVDGRYRADRQTIVTSNVDLAKLPAAVGPRTARRLTEPPAKTYRMEARR